MRSAPLWWSEARALRAEGLSFAEIGRRCGGKDPTTVMYAVDDDKRERWGPRKRACAAQQDRRTLTPDQKARNRVLRKAHGEAQATGRHVDEVLVGWRTYPRRGATA